jgi:hypothetical protein
MSARTILASAAILAASSTCGWTQSWGFGVEVGPPVYYGPPPVYTYDVDPYYYPEPPIYEQEPPIVIMPEEPPVRYAASPDDVLDMLEDEGFRNLSPMAERGAYYKLSAINPEGELVALEISIRSGEIEREIILEGRRGPRPMPRVVAATPAAPPAPPPAIVSPPPSGDAPAPMRDRLRVPPGGQGGDDPLVIY